MEVGMKVVCATEVKLRDVVRIKPSESDTNEFSVVYCNPRRGCIMFHMMISLGKGWKTRLSKHKNDVRAQRLSNSLVVHVDERGLKLAGSTNSAQKHKQKNY